MRLNRSFERVGTEYCYNIPSAGAVSMSARTYEVIFALSDVPLCVFSFAAWSMRLGGVALASRRCDVGLA